MSRPIRLRRPRRRHRLRRKAVHGLTLCTVCRAWCLPVFCRPRPSGFRSSAQVETERTHTIPSRREGGGPGAGQSSVAGVPSGIASFPFSFLFLSARVIHPTPPSSSVSPSLVSDAPASSLSFPPSFHTIFGTRCTTNKSQMDNDTKTRTHEKPLRQLRSRPTCSCAAKLASVRKHVARHHPTYREREL